ncbi:Electron transport complex protein RnfD [Candidatus Arsenophonus lipoptenae]|uniref:Ion-translocating oxidoreductase complex subunit D n=1 Tax=Candidatus Arsenophonus lipoptenae TaxID=634113 RepID=A0A0X9W5X2_9GAMM|nr:RnfABCDGE type electron transport complex subunit D [Candidatus Arsenophonus lipoptenae]AMA64642.1 Electron transport complex protein RnfD [Candidatus Arsenophonus lipoptenae]
MKINNLKIASLPFIYKKQSISNIMLLVVIASIPGICCQIYFFNSGTVYQILVAIITALICESIALKLRKFSVINNLKDNSALVTAIILAISIPPLSPWWLIVLGTSFAILIAKHVYGGLGQNIFNPAMVGYVVLLISFPMHMNNWASQIEYQFINKNIITPSQIIFKGNTITKSISNHLTINDKNLNQNMLFKSFKNSILNNSINKIYQKLILKDSSINTNINWLWINIAYLFGGIIMIHYKIISWQIPLAFLTTVVICSLLSWLIMPSEYNSPIVHLFFSGRTMLSCFFIATDPVTATNTKNGRIIYGSLIGLLVWIAHIFGSYHDAFAVLLANICAPVIDHYSKHRIYSYK